MVKNQSHRPRLFLLPAILILLSGCNESPDPQSTPADLRINGSEFKISDDPSIKAVLAASEQIYTRSCSADATLSRLESNERVNLGPFWYATCDGPIVAIPLKPGEFQEYPPLTPKSMNMVPGTYRFETYVYLDSTLHESVQLTSHSFDLIQ